MNYTCINYKHYELFLYYQQEGVVALSRGSLAKYASASYQATSVYQDALEQYFLGNHQDIDTALVASGTVFQNKVWDVLKTIPYGSLWTYKDVAIALGDARKVRAVATAIGKNPYTIIIPCHRVIGSDGHLHGYAGGLDLKASLISLEKEHTYEKQT